MRNNNYNLEDVRSAVKQSKSIASVLRILGLRPVGGNYKTIHRIIDENHIDTSHFTGQGWNVGLIFKPNRVISDEEVFVADSKYTCSWRVRERYKSVPNDRYYDVMVMLNSEIKALAAEKRNDTKPVFEIIDTLEREIDEFIKK